ncbi:hypothetical protein D3C87_2076070 [compost metagenome]
MYAHRSCVVKHSTGATGTAGLQVQTVAIIGHSSQPNPDYFLYRFFVSDAIRHLQIKR